MLDNKTFIVDESIKTVDKQFRDPDTFAPGDFYNFIREAETIKQIEKDLSEEVNNLE